jgi:hypothetical protein
MTGIIFQGNPREFNIDQYLSSRRRIRWLVNQQWREINAGDIAFIWRSNGTRPGSGGLVAVGRVLTPPVDMEDDVPGLWTEPPRARIALRVEIELEEVRLDPHAGMLLRSDLKHDARLSDMLIFRMANRTTFVLAPAHTSRLRSLWDTARRPIA